MRLIGILDKRALAEKFGNVLYLRGIENRIEAEDDGTYGIWILDEGKIPDALNLLGRFETDPEGADFHRSTEQAQVLRFKQRLQDRFSRNRTIDVRTHWHRYDRQIGPLSGALIVICVLVAIVSGLGNNPKILQPLFMTNYVASDGLITYHTGLLEVQRGQVWRLVTPIFIHFGILHLIFNLLWLKDLGTIIERRQGSLYLGLLVLAIAVLSNLGQFYVSGPTFGGMSGVVYGLLGYMWMRGKFDPASGLSLNPTVVTMMIIWFFLCLSGLVGNVANAAHAVGLASGMIWGFLTAKLRRA
jgi:GlpG protein